MSDQGSEKGRQAASRGLDWLNLFVANVQTGFGPFLAVYLTTAGWTQTTIGVALSIGTFSAMLSQIPAGALVDAARSKALVSVFSILAFTMSALMFTVAPIPLFVYLGQILHAYSSCTLGPSIVAMSLGIAGRHDLGPRLGRNARFASIGNGVGAALMGACGYFISERAVFFLTAILTLPAMAAILPISRFLDRRGPSPGQPIAHEPEQAEARKEDETPKLPIGRALGSRPLLVLAGCIMLFTLSNAALLPLASTAVTSQAGTSASLIIAACIVLPQVIVALISPTVGRLADVHGRRPLLLLGFSMLPLRGILLATTTDPVLVVLFQMLDGVAAACFGVMLPLVTTDIAGRSGHLNLALGFVGFAVGVGATLSTTAAGWIADGWGTPVAFLALAAAGLAGVLLVQFVMPETRPINNDPPA